MNEGNISQKFRLKNLDEIRNYLIEEINKNELISKKHKKFFNYIEHLLILISTVSAGIKKLIIKKKKHDKHCYPIV